MRQICLQFSALLIFTAISVAQSSDQINPDLLDDYWSAQWIAHPDAPPFDYGVFHFRKTFHVDDQPETFIVHVSGDNRYELYVNGKQMSEGPASNDLFSWSFETVDIAPDLINGENVIAAKVWNGGEFRPMAWMTHRTGLIVQGNSENEHAVNTNNSWHVLQNEGYSPITFRQNDPELLWEYYVAGATDSLVAAKYPWGWKEAGYSTAQWQNAREIVRGAPAGRESHQRWHLSPRKIPALAQQNKMFSRIARVNGDPVSEDFLQGNETMIPANSKSVVLIDFGELTTGSPVLDITGGEGSTIKMRYSEALYLEHELAENRKIKGHRDQIEGQDLFGVYDVFIPDGGKYRSFRPLNPRTFRWIELSVETADEDLILENLSAIEIIYPSSLEARFSGNDNRVNEIWDAGWRTQELSVQETFVSDLYWERMQYLGDTKIQAVTWMYMTSDDRPVRLALEQFNRSRAYFGLTESRYPSWLEQYIPLYSLVWVTMVHDYWMHRSDDDFIEQFLPGIEQVLDWFDSKLNEDGLLEPLPYFDYIDWGYTDRRNQIAASDDKSMAVHSLFYAWTLDQAADLFSYFDKDDKALKYNREAEQLKKQVYDCCFDAETGLYADSPAKNYFSMQTNILAVLTDAIHPEQQVGLLMRMLDEPDILPVEMYFEYYMGRALNKAGLGDLYLTRLQPWTNMLDAGMGTFGEVKVNPRSECHAWSASPNYEFLATVAGVEPAVPGFKEVLIRPNPGALTSLRSVIPHPLGEISLNYNIDEQNRLEADITLPDGLTGQFKWKGELKELISGRQVFQFD